MTPARRLVGITVLGTTASVLPAFLTGAVAVQLDADLRLGDTGLGLAVAAFFTTAALGSALLGRAAERLGATPAMRLGLVITVVAQLLLATVVSSAWTLALALAVGGCANALTQPAANLMLAGRLPAGRLGFAFALKQSGMPLASLLGGAAVPALAITVGWRAAYAAGLLLAVGVLLAIPADVAAAGPREVVRRAPRPDLPPALLRRYAAAGLLGAAAAGIVVAFLVTAAERAGVPAAQAGLLLTGGSLLGITSRITHGALADRGSLLPLRRVALLLTVGAAGLLVMALDVPAAYLLGVVPAFACGWAWPGLFNLSVVQRNPSAPAAATGVSQTGVYIGAGAGPAVGGLLAGWAGYPALWLVCAVTLLAAAAVVWGLIRRLRALTATPDLPAGGEVAAA